MNNPIVFMAIGLLLTAIVFGVYVLWRKSPRRPLFKPTPLGSGKPKKDPDLASKELGGKLESPATASILSGAIRAPIREIRYMFGLYMLFGITLAILSLFLQSEIPEIEDQWVAYPFLVVGLAMVAAGSFWGSHLNRAGRVERIASLLAYRLGVDLIQITCWVSGAVCLLLAVVGSGYYLPKAGPLIIAIPSVLGIVLVAIGIWRPRLSKSTGKIAGTDTPPL